MEPNVFGDLTIVGIAGHQFQQTLQRMKSDWLYRSWVVSKVLTILGMCMQCQPTIRLHHLANQYQTQIFYMLVQMMELSNTPIMEGIIGQK